MPTDVVPVAVKGLTSTGVGVWTLVVMFATAVVGGLIKIAPKWRELGIGERSRQIDEMRADMLRLTERVLVSEAHSKAVDIRLRQLEFVLKMVTDELEEVAPKNAVAARARALFNDMNPPLGVTPDMAEQLREIDRREVG